MRTDATIDKRQVLCRNASCIGFGKIQAQVGNLVMWRDVPDGQLLAGRMIGRVHYAPALSGDTKSVRDYILVIGLNPELSHTFERWVNPTTVERVEVLNHACADRRAVMEYFLSDEMTRATVDEVRRATEWGGSGLRKYRAYMAQRRADERCRHDA